MQVAHKSRHFIFVSSQGVIIILSRENLVISKLEFLMKKVNSGESLEIKRKLEPSQIVLSFILCVSV